MARTSTRCSGLLLALRLTRVAGVCPRVSQSFTVTRDGHPIGQSVPLRRRRRFVSRQEFAAMSRTAPGIGLDRFRADQDATADTYPDDPYDR